VKAFQARFVHGLCIADKKRPPTVMVGGSYGLKSGDLVPRNSLAGERGSRSRLPRSSRGITDLESVPRRTNGFFWFRFS